MIPVNGIAGTESPVVAKSRITQTFHERTGAPRASIQWKLTRRVEAHPQRVPSKGGSMSLILFIILIVLLVGALPTWPYSSGWGYYPSGGLGLVVLILLILLLMGRL